MPRRGVGKDHAPRTPSCWQWDCAAWLISCALSDTNVASQTLRCTRPAAAHLSQPIRHCPSAKTRPSLPARHYPSDTARLPKPARRTPPECPVRRTQPPARRHRARRTLPADPLASQAQSLRHPDAQRLHHVIPARQRPGPAGRLQRSDRGGQGSWRPPARTVRKLCRAFKGPVGRAPPAPAAPRQSPSSSRRSTSASHRRE